MTNQTSKCCNAPIDYHTADEGTGFMVCKKCQKACDLQPISRHQENGLPITNQTPSEEMQQTIREIDFKYAGVHCLATSDDTQEGMLNDIRKLLTIVNDLESQCSTLQREKEVLTKGIEEGQYLMTSIIPSNEVAKAYRHFTDLLHSPHASND